MFLFQHRDSNIIYQISNDSEQILFQIHRKENLIIDVSMIKEITHLDPLIIECACTKKKNV